MKPTEANDQEVHISCDVCMDQIPLSESISDEARDYIVHFCGLDCYQQWKTQKEAEEHKKAE